MADYVLPQQDQAKAAERALEVKNYQNTYNFDFQYYGIPVSSFQDKIHDYDGPVWITQLVATLVDIRYNIYYALEGKDYAFANTMPPSLTHPEQFGGWLNEAMDSGNFSGEAIAYFVPDMGYGKSSTRPKSIQDYKDLFKYKPLPALAVDDHFVQDEYFARTFLAGPNPVVIQRMDAIPSNFPINDTHLQANPALLGDSLGQAIAERRVFYCDYAVMSDLRNSTFMPSATKYIFAPLVAFALPRNGGPLQPFAIQCNQTPQVRPIFTPAHGYSWRIARNCVLAAHNTYHEAVTHLGTTHLLIEPIAVSARRNFSRKHPVWALLNHHTEGTLQINHGAMTTLIKPLAALDQLVGSDIGSLQLFVKQMRLNFSFRSNYLPNRFANNRTSTTDAPMLTDYPYRDDGSDVWNNVAAWTQEFVQIFYGSDAAVQGDYELQAWAAEISSPQLGNVRDFGDTPGRISSMTDLAQILCMIIWTAGPQHAAVNFSQITDMGFAPANPFCTFTPEPMRFDLTEQDYLDSLPDMEVAITAVNWLSLLSGVHYTTLGGYNGAKAFFNGAIVNFSNGPIAEAVKRFNRNLSDTEERIKNRNKSRIPYTHLLPSLIPQSINI